MKDSADADELDNLIAESGELAKIFGQIIITASKNNDSFKSIIPR